MTRRETWARHTKYRDHILRILPVDPPGLTLNEVCAGWWSAQPGPRLPASTTVGDILRGLVIDGRINRTRSDHGTSWTWTYWTEK
jgi:hypothetical protein